MRNKNRRKAIFNWAAKGLFFLWGEGVAIHTQATIKPCRQPLHATPGLEIKKILWSPFGDQPEKYSRQMQIFSRQFV